MRRRTILPPLFCGIIVLVLWEGGCRIFKIPQYLLPAPSKIVAALFDEPLNLLKHTGVTLFEALLGFIIANIFAVLLSVCMVFVSNLDKAIMPFAIALKTTPVVAMAPLLLLWFGTGIAPKIIAAALICFFPALVNSIKGFNALLEGEEDLFRIYGASKGQLLMKLRFQRAAPYIFSALKVSSSLSIVGAIVGEFVGANEGIGYVILVSSYHLETVKMFAALAATAIAGICFYSIISYLDRKVVFWLDSPSDEIRFDSPRIPLNRRGKL